MSTVPLHRLLLCALIAGLSGHCVLADPAATRAAFTALESAQTLIQAGDADKAVIGLKRFLDDSSQRIYDQALALEMLGHAYLASDNYAGAIKAFERSLSLDVLPGTTVHRIRYNLAQLYLATERFDKGIEVLEQWFHDEQTPTPSARVVLGNAYVQVRQYDKAVEQLQRAIAGTAEPREIWYQALLGAHYELKNYAACTEVLQDMIHRFPQQERYWKQLAGVYLLRDRHDDALSVMELAYTQKYLGTEQDLLQLAQLYSYLSAPYKAGVLMEKEMRTGKIRRTTKNLETLSHAWLQAREYAKAATALDEAATQSGDPELTLRLARLYLEQGQLEDVAAQLQALNPSGHVMKEKIGKLWLWLGSAYYELRDAELAKGAFREALKYPSDRDAADQWLVYLEETRRCIAGGGGCAGDRVTGGLTGIE